MSWLCVAVLILGECSVAVGLVRLAVKCRPDAILVLILSVAVLQPVERFLTGDISNYLPDFIWSKGADGKDQIVYVSVASTIVVAMTLASLGVLLVHHWTSHRPARRQADPQGPSD